ncbi:MAG TPA: alpha/beta hydrolase [Verrucomicrobiota bacterium]|nr:endo-1,4-beta-xylanase [Verrucomicrobiales bacterium]HRI11928.1 alpha/beta hydrolase [Verrucomicrobiota bacterium]
MNPWIVLATTLLIAPSLRAEVRDPIPLWPAGAPGALGQAAQDSPTVTPYLPDPGRASGAAIVVCPGGGYGGLAPHEGNDYALFLNRAGIACFVLKYRLGSNGYRHPVMLNDAARAVRWVRANAAAYQVDPKRVGIMGSSAGGHLASTLMTHFDAGDPAATDPIERLSSRPDLGILCYPVITMESFGHAGSKRNLLGDTPSAELIRLLSNETQVTAQTPPAFIWHTWEDKAVPVRNALEFAAALDRNKVPFDLHIYQAGQHGIGLATKPPEFTNPHPWAADLLFWLKGQNFVK